MNKLVKILTVLIAIMLTNTGCVNNSFSTGLTTVPSEKTTLNKTIVDIANQLKQSSRLTIKDTGTIAITTFVDLNKFDKTTHFGRILGESMFNELFVRGFNVSDFRGQGAISINKKGEFYITRDTLKLKNEIANTYILVGTYTKIDNDILLNVRIMDNNTGKILASARAIYNNNYCTLDENICIKTPVKTKRKIKIITDEASTLI